jgi:hypothetical protein
MRNLTTGQDLQCTEDRTWCSLVVGHSCYMWWDTPDMA